MDLLQGDMVFAPDLDGTIIKLIVQKNKSLKDPSALVKVKHIEKEEELKILISSLILHKGFVAILPSNMFEVHGRNVSFAPAAEEMLLELNEVKSLYSDDDLALLPEIDCDLINNDNEVMEEDAPCGSGMAGIKRRISESSDDDENVSIKEKERVKRKGMCTW